MDEVVLRRLIILTDGTMGNVYVTQGKQRLDRQLGGYNNAARFSAWCVLRDLNGDASCATELRLRLLPKPSPLMRFRVVVRSIEAWLMADRERIASFLSISQSTIPHLPDDLPNPKQILVDLARRSHKRAVREGIVPASGGGRHVGPDYTSLMIEYVESRWRPEVASRSSDSLRRCIGKLRELVE